MTEPTLLPCAHCGSGAQFRMITCENDENFGAQYIECIVCHISTPLLFPCMDEVKTQLAEKWNRRANSK